MPVRCLKRIFAGGSTEKRRISIQFPLSIKNAFKIDEDDVFVCEFKRHFDTNKILIQEINETEKIAGLIYLGFSQPEFILKECSIAKKYGLREGEYIEIIFREIERTKSWEEGIIFKRTKRKTKTIPIFPERTVEDLDFTPK